MTGPLRDIEVALADIRVFKGMLTRLESTLESLRETALQDRLSQLPPCDVPVTEHRREHRSGRAPKIPNDPELQAFILARIDRAAEGNFGDWKSIAGAKGLCEMRIPYGQGFRIYYAVFGTRVVLLLAGSTKQAQDRTIAKAKEYLAEANRRAES